MQWWIRKGEHMTKGRNKKKIGLLTAVAAVAVVLLVCCVPAIRARALFDEDSAVRFRTFKQSNTIEDSVLFIGTHLIHMQGLTDELYEVAAETASDAGQYNIYYKSELADGAWFDITDAGGLADISSEGTPVDESELDDLWVTCYTGKDGITKDAKSGDSVCIFDDPSPYDLLNLKELESIRQVSDGKYNERGEGIARYYYDMLHEFFNTDVTTDTTKQCDETLKKLQKCYESYSRAEMDEQAQVVMSLMESVDAMRRTEVFYRLCEQEDSLVDWLLEVAMGERYDHPEDYDSEEFLSDETLIEAVSTALQQCKESYTTYQSKQLDEGKTALRTYIYEQSMLFLARCESSDGDLTEDAEADGIIANIRYAMNIEKDVVGDAEQELALIEDRFLPETEQAYEKLLTSGASDSYQTAKSSDKGLAMLESILRADQTTLEAAREDMQFMIGAARIRMSSSDALDYVYARMSRAEELRAGIRDDDMKGYANESVSAHIEWLNEQAQQIINGDASLMSKLAQLQAKLKDYLNKQQEALDNNNLELAAQYGALADDMSSQIADERARLNAVLHSDTATDKEKAEAQVALGNSSLLDTIDGMKKDAMTAINTGDTTGLSETLNALAVLGAEDALKDIQDALDASTLSDDKKKSLGKELDTAKEKSKDSSLYDMANTGADGSSTGGTAGTYTASELENMIAQAFGGAFDSLSAEQQLAVVAALEWLYEEYGNTNARTLAQQYAQSCSSAGNPYIYTQLSDVRDTKYAPLAVLAQASGYRYVYSDSKQEATLTAHGATLSFRVGSNKVTKTDGTVLEIKNYKVEYQNNLPYVDQDTAETYFSCKTVYVTDSSYGICLNKTAENLADTLYQVFTGETES